MSKKCYCKPGYFGKNCELHSQIADKISEFSSYKSVDMSSSIKMYWKILRDSEEIEVIVRSKTKTWIAVGWRPTNITKACKSFWGEQMSKTPKLRFKRDSKQPLSKSQIKKFTPKGEFHDMDCTDIIIGVAKGELGRVVDSYTRDRSTPMSDDMYGGKNDLTAAMAYEDDEGTVMIFRKKLVADHPSDHSIETGLMHVIWAQGQESGKYSHAPRSGIEADNPSDPEFYKEDEIKYHGKKNRGDRKLQLLHDHDHQSAEVSDANCMFRFPADCLDTCQYTAKWQFENEKVKFYVSSSLTDKWMGIGFSSNTYMVTIYKCLVNKI